MSQIRMNLTVDDDVPGMLESLSKKKKKMGAYLSALVRRLYNGESFESDKSLAQKYIELEMRVRQLEGKTDA